MNEFSVTILGAASAKPGVGKMSSAQVVKHNNSYYLLDCAEGTTAALMQMGIPISKINDIFITHRHIDHILGLPGLLAMYSLNDRKHELNLYAPGDFLDEYSLIIERAVRHYKLNIIKMEEKFCVDALDPSVIYENNSLKVHKVRLEHRDIPTYGYVFREKKRLPNIKPEAITKYRIPYNVINSIKQGLDFKTLDGKVVPHIELCTPAPKPRSYAYITDTRYFESQFQYVKNVDLMYHEASFMECDGDKADMYGHSTARSAAFVAREADVKQLLLGHISARYETQMDELIAEAKEIFPKTYLAEEKRTYHIGEDILV